MSLATNVANLATRIATEMKALRTLINGNAADLSALTTTDKTTVVAAINEVKSLVGAGSATALDDLTDVVVSTPASGHVLRHNGTNFVNVLGTTYFDAAGAAAAAQSAAIAASQPLDSDLTAIAALTTTTYGRAVLALANQAALMGLLSAASSTDQGIVELATTSEATTGTDSTRAVTPVGLKAAVDALETKLVASAPGALDTLNELAAALGNDANFASTVTTSLAGKQPIDTDLTAIAALTSAANQLAYATGTGTWAMTTLTSAGRALLDDATAADQLTTLGAVASTDVGNTATDFVATFEAGL